MRDYSHPIWLSATEGGEGMELGCPSHWTKKESGEIFSLGMNLSTTVSLGRMTSKIQGKETLPKGCPCTSDSPPVLQLRGSRPTLNPSDIL